MQLSRLAARFSARGSAATSSDVAAHVVDLQPRDRRSFWRVRCGRRTGDVFSARLRPLRRKMDKIAQGRRAVADKTWGSQFRRSIEAGPEEFQYYSGQIVSSEGADELFAVGWNALAHAYTNKALRHLETLTSTAESPIERAMLFALCIAGHEAAENVRYKKGGYLFGDVDAMPDVLTIEPQAQLGEYRVDFLLTYEGAVPDFAHKRKLKDGMEIPGVKEVTVHLIVECDGHDYHDRSKEQASRDRQRDRELKKLGYEVFRYTGADIWKDALKCAREAVQLLNTNAWK